MSRKSIEISYDAGAVPPGFIHAFDFSQKATALIETWLAAAGAGSWSGANAYRDPATGRIAVSTRFQVEDSDRAEALIRAATEGTPFGRWQSLHREG